MLGRRFGSFRPSLRRWARTLALVWLVGAGSMSVISIYLLEQISDDARSTYGTEIPNLVNRSRIAMKLERLSSFTRQIGWTRDPVIERRTLMQLQTLAQSFDLDGDQRFSGAASHVVASARKVIALHGVVRKIGAASPPGGDPERERSTREADQSAQQVCDEALRQLDELSDSVSTDTALTADRLANRIQVNASRVEHGWFAALSVFVTFGFLLLYMFQRHVLSPIAGAVSGLEAISRSDDHPLELPRARFFELDMIGRSIEQYARFAADLRMANVALRVLSSQDGLTGLANRRGFDAGLAEACRRWSEDGVAFALLLIDVDHFKRLNDRFGHPVGDQCLRQVALTLQSTCARGGGQVSRYGGEEFAVVLSDMSLERACDLADQLREAVERTQLYVSGARRALAVTVSIGLTLAAPDASPDRVIEAADAALYRAKHEGRNRVCTSEPEDALARASRPAA